jgi:hypothetical protein
MSISDRKKTARAVSVYEECDRASQCWALKRAVCPFGQEENSEDRTGVLDRKKTAGTEWSGGGPRTTVTLAMFRAILQGVDERFP